MQLCPAIEKYAVKTTKELIEQWPSVRKKKMQNLSKIGPLLLKMTKYIHYPDRELYEKLQKMSGKLISEAKFTGKSAQNSSKLLVHSYCVHYLV